MVRRRCNSEHILRCGTSLKIHRIGYLIGIIVRIGTIDIVVIHPTAVISDVPGFQVRIVRGRILIEIRRSVHKTHRCSLHMIRPTDAVMRVSPFKHIIVKINHLIGFLMVARIDSGNLRQGDIRIIHNEGIGSSVLGIHDTLFIAIHLPAGTIIKTHSAIGRIIVLTVVITASICHTESIIICFSQENHTRCQMVIRISTMQIYLAIRCSATTYIEIHT